MFIDPPYYLESDEVSKILGLVSPKADCVIVLERRSQDPAPELPSLMELLREVTYGDTIVYFLATGGAQ